MALSEVVTHINEMTMQASDKKFVFVWSELNKLYCRYLKEFGMEVQAWQSQAGNGWRG